MRFIHAADIHLGYLQYGERERYNDFGHAWGHLVDETLRQRADCLVLAGDLFHKRSIEPRTLLQAAVHLQRLHDAGIPVVAVEGNHDRPYPPGGFSWLDYLAESGLLVLLSPEYGAEQHIEVLPWDADKHYGAYIDIGAVRFYGCKYYGASTPRVVDDLAQHLAEQPEASRAPYTVLLLHAGLPDVIDQYVSPLSLEQLDALKPHVDYVALGHIHRPFARDNWVFNPGSLETNGLNEAAWTDRGYLLVEVDEAPGDDGRVHHRVTQIPTPRREFVRLSFDVDAYATPDALASALDDYLGQMRRADDDRRPVVELRLKGVLRFDRSGLDARALHNLALERLNPLVLELRDTTTANEMDIRVDEAASRADIERQVVHDLLEREERLREDSERWTSLALGLKSLAGSESGSELVTETIAALSAFTEELDGADQAD